MTAPADRFAAALRGFGPLGLFAILIVLAGNLVAAPLSALLVLVWAGGSHTPWRELGFVPLRRWPAVVALAIVAGTAFKLLMKAVVMPFLGAPPLNAAYGWLAGNTAALPGILAAVTLGAGFGEETFYRSYLFERLGRLLGTQARAKAVIVLLTAGLFGLAHQTGQGVPGVQQATITGLVFGSVYAATGVIWPVMIAHAAFDVTAVALIYWRLEAAVAHLFFQ